MSLCSNFFHALTVERGFQLSSTIRASRLQDARKIGAKELDRNRIDRQARIDGVRSRKLPNAYFPVVSLFSIRRPAANSWAVIWPRNGHRCVNQTLQKNACEPTLSSMSDVNWSPPVSNSLISECPRLDLSSSMVMNAQAFEPYVYRWGTSRE
jgi:hypothetical protein